MSKSLEAIRWIVETMRAIPEQRIIGKEKWQDVINGAEQCLLYCEEQDCPPGREAALHHLNRFGYVLSAQDPIPYDDIGQLIAQAGWTIDSYRKEMTA